MFVAKAIFDMTIYISLMNQTIITKYRQKKKKKPKKQYIWKNVETWQKIMKIIELYMNYPNN